MSTCQIEKQILEQAHIGIWTIELEDGKAPRMYADDTMKRVLLGIHEELTPEETYVWWYERIHPDYFDTVSDGVDKILSGKHAEIQYPWTHPERGMIYVRCGGVRDQTYEKGARIGGCHQDVTDLVQYHRDSLTGLYSMDFFLQRAEEIMAQNPDQKYKILVSNIINFKVINDKYGARKGDELLKFLAETGRKLFPNFIIGARLYADKFVCLQHGIPMTREEGLKLEQAILENSPVPNITWKHGIYYTKYNPELPVIAMVDRARLALESIRDNYDVKCAVYDEKLRTDLIVNQQIVDDAKKALELEQFQVYLQPKHDLHKDVTGGAEALVRWIHPELGFISPGNFIPVFEQNGFIRNLDKYVLHKVCQIINRWEKEKKPCVPISVNLSRRDFETEDIADRIIRVVDSYGVDHGLIHLELTETAFSDNPERISKTIKELHDHGFVIELDDFGTGYSSLITLSDLAFDVLKLDMSIIRNDDPKSDRNVLDFCTHLVKMMKLQSVAEGVETREQRDRLQALGCDYIQGYYYAKPMPVEEFEQYLLNEK